MSNAKISTKQLTLLLISNIIGSGIFLVQSDMYTNTSSNIFSLLCWCVGAFVVLLFGQCYAELASTYPLEGGDTWYLQLAYGKIASYIYGLVSVFLILPCGCALMMKLFLSEDAYICNNGICRLMISLLFALFNYVGGNVVFRFQYVLSVCKVCVMSLFGILALLVFLRLITITDNAVPRLELFKQHHPDMDTGVRSVVTQLAAGTAGILWTYDGWNSGNFIAHRVRTPFPSFPIAIACASVLVWLLYLFINIAFMYVIPAEKRALTDVVSVYFGCLDIAPFLRSAFSKAINVLPSLGTFNGSFIIAASIIENYAAQFIKYWNRDKITAIEYQISEQDIPFTNTSQQFVKDPLLDECFTKPKNEVNNSCGYIIELPQNEQAVTQQASDSASGNSNIRQSQEQIEESRNLLDTLDKNSKSHIAYLKLVFILIFALSVYGYSFIEKAGDIMDKLSFSIYLFYGLSISAILILRKKEPSINRPYKMPLIAIITCIAFSILLGAYNIDKSLGKS